MMSDFVIGDRVRLSYKFLMNVNHFLGPFVKIRQAFGTVFLLREDGRVLYTLDTPYDGHSTAIIYSQDLVPFTPVEERTLLLLRKAFPADKGWRATIDEMPSLPGRYVLYRFTGTAAFPNVPDHEQDIATINLDELSWCCSFNVFGHLHSSDGVVEYADLDALIADMVIRTQPMAEDE